MKILILSWKDINHPNKGGAEVVLRNYAKRLISKGYEVTWVGSGFDNCVKEETIDGVNILRLFNIDNIYFKFPGYYKKSLKGKYDLIIDEAGGIPLLSPLYEKKIPIIFFIHHIGEKEWDFKFSFPFNIIGRFIFSLIIKLYRNKQTITVSKSSKDDLVKNFGFKKEKVTVIENALDLEVDESIDIYKKKKTILFFGRLMPLKRVEDAIKAFDYFNKKDSSYKLNIIGPYQDTKYLKELVDLTIELKIEDKVKFLGGISLEDRYKIAQNKLMLVPSYKEGYGLIVLEGNIYGIPAIGYNVAGLRDSIKDGINGFLVKDLDYKAMGEKIYEVLSNENNYKKMIESSFNYVIKHNSWDDNTDKLDSLIKNITISKK